MGAQGSEDFVALQDCRLPIGRRTHGNLKATDGRSNERQKLAFDVSDTSVEVMVLGMSKDDGDNAFLRKDGPSAVLNAVHVLVVLSLPSHE